MLCNICNPSLSIFEIDIADAEIGAIKAILLDEIEKLMTGSLSSNIANCLSRLEDGSDEEIYL